MRITLALVALLLAMGCSLSLKARLEKDVESVNYADGIDETEADILARHYRLNNFKWFAISDPIDDGDYWSFKLLNGRTHELIESPPLRVYKKAWSYKSALVFDRKAY